MGSKYMSVNSLIPILNRHSSILLLFAMWQSGRKQGVTNKMLGSRRTFTAEDVRSLLKAVCADDLSHVQKARMGSYQCISVIYWDLPN